jgi:hypothetical protein
MFPWEKKKLIETVKKQSPHLYTHRIFYFSPIFSLNIAINLFIIAKIS